MTTIKMTLLRRLPGLLATSLSAHRPPQPSPHPQIPLLPCSLQPPFSIQTPCFLPTCCCVLSIRDGARQPMFLTSCPQRFWGWGYFENNCAREPFEEAGETFQLDHVPFNTSPTLHFSYSLHKFPSKLKFCCPRCLDITDMDCSFWFPSFPTHSCSMICLESA